MDYAHRETEKAIKALEKRLRKEYRAAEKEVKAKLDDYFERYELKDQKWREWVETGYKTPEEYEQWRIGQLAVGDRWKTMQKQLAQDLANVNKIARQIVRGKTPEVYALNFNWSTYEIEKATGLNTGFTLYSRDTVAYLMRDNPKLLPDPGEKRKKNIINALDVRYNRQQLQSVMMQGILQGVSLPELSRKLAEEVGEKDYKSAIRNARTMMTGAQNAGRIGSYNRAAELGIKLKKTWVAVHDMRTRHAHRQLDGQTVEVNEPFKSELGDIMFPGDPNAKNPSNIYNCRCTLLSQIKGYEIDPKKMHPENVGDMTYEEWRESRKEVHNPITLPEEKQNNIRMAWISEYRHGGKKGQKK